MMQHWTKLYTTHNYAEASIIKGMLEENSIPVTIFNKQASPYIGIGDDIEIYVARQFENVAQGLITGALFN